MRMALWCNVASQATKLLGLIGSAPPPWTYWRVNAWKGFGGFALKIQFVQALSLILLLILLEWFVNNDFIFKMQSTVYLFTSINIKEIFFKATSSLVKLCQPLSGKYIHKRCKAIISIDKRFRYSNALYALRATAWWFLTTLAGFHQSCPSQCTHVWCKVENMSNTRSKEKLSQRSQGLGAAVTESWLQSQDLWQTGQLVTQGIILIILFEAWY